LVIKCGAEVSWSKSAIRLNGESSCENYDIENDLHEKIFIAKVKNNISAFNYIEKSVKVYENKPMRISG
jgi:hypothetical protein